MEILNSCSECDEIQFKEDGSWAPMRSKKEVQEVSASYNGVDSGMPVDLVSNSNLTLIWERSLTLLFPHRFVWNRHTRAETGVF